MPGIVTSLKLLKVLNVLHNTGRTNFIMKDGGTLWGKRRRKFIFSLGKQTIWRKRERGSEQENGPTITLYTGGLQAMVCEDPTWKILRE